MTLTPVMATTPSTLCGTVTSSTSSFRMVWAIQLHRLLALIIGTAFLYHEHQQVVVFFELVTCQVSVFTAYALFVSLLLILLGARIKFWPFFVLLRVLRLVFRSGLALLSLFIPWPRRTRQACQTVVVQLASGEYRTAVLPVPDGHFTVMTAQQVLFHGHFHRGGFVVRGARNLTTQQCWGWPF